MISTVDLPACSELLHSAESLSFFCSFLSLAEHHICLDRALKRMDGPFLESVRSRRRRQTTFLFKSCVRRSSAASRPPSKWRDQWSRFFFPPHAEVGLNERSVSHRVSQSTFPLSRESVSQVLWGVLPSLI